MKRHLFQAISAFCLIATLSLVSCNKEDIPGENPEIQQPAANEITFTATLAPKGEGPLSKAISTGTDANDKEILNVAWAEGEEIAVYYQKTDNSYATATATIGTPNGDGSAPITAKLTNAKGGTAKFVYPATLANSKGEIDEGELLSQNGNLTGANGISTKFDAATGEGTITVSGSEASVSGTVTMTNRVCICKFHFDILEGAGYLSNERNFSPVIIRDGNGHTYTITSDKADGVGGTRGFNRNDDVYVAMLPVSGKTVSFYTKYSNHYLYTATGTTLTAGKFYRDLPIDMVKDESGQCNKYRDLRDGSITANDGDIIYQRANMSTTDKTITIPDGYTVTLAGVNISATGSAGIICSGDATINLEGANTVTTSAYDYPAVQVGPTGKTLTIQGGGSLTATGGDNGAGIGSMKDGTCGNLTTTGGTITASGGAYAAGIGSGIYGSCGNITINGGTVTAIGGTGSAGIGTGIGDDVNKDYSICGDITISGGEVTAEGNREAAGIGSGYCGKFGNISIAEGITSVTATAGWLSTNPIGKGIYDGGSGSVTIDGTTTWTAGTATTHLNWTVSTVKDTYTNKRDATRWTLTHK